MYDIEKSLGFLLAKAYQRAFATFRLELEPYEMTPPQFGILRFLWQEDGMTRLNYPTSVRWTELPWADCLTGWKEAGLLSVSGIRMTDGHT